jgi:hypothetical protein
MSPHQIVAHHRLFDRGRTVAVDRPVFSASWKEAAVAALLRDGEAAAAQMEKDADALDYRAESPGIAHLLRDRARDIRRELKRRRRQN